MSSFYKKIVNTFICACILTFSSTLHAGSESFFADDFTTLFLPSESPKNEAPDPGALKLNWSEYVDVKDVQELAQHIAALKQNFSLVLYKLQSKDQDNASTYINNILLNLNTLLAEKRQPPLEVPSLKPFQNSYTIEDLLEIHNKIKLANAEKKNEDDEAHSLKNLISKKQKHLDTLTINYMAMTNLTAEKIMTGLEIMSAKTSILSAQEHLKKTNKRLEIEKTKISFLEREADAAKDLFDKTAFDQPKLERNIKAAEQELERKQADLKKLENTLNADASQNSQDKNNRHLLSQKLIHFASLRSIAWTNLAFHNLKYNLYMHLNKHFDESNLEMHEKLEEWIAHLDRTEKNVDEWKKAVLREQERVRKDLAVLVAQHEPNDSKSMKLNNARRQESLETYASLQLLEDEVANTRWLIEQLQGFIKKNSSFIEIGWINFTGAISSTWTFIDSCLNYTLFKLGELPITFMSLLRVAVIMTFSFLASKLISKALISFGNRGRSVTTSTLYTLGRLAHYFTLIIGALLALASIGFDFSNLVIVASALTLGIGFGLQSFANNFICGLRILFERNLKVGDYIELQSGTYGKVMEIHVQNTIILTSDGTTIVVPNSELTNHTLINYTMNHNYKRINIPFSVSTDADKNLVRKIVIEAAQKVALIAPAQYGAPQVWLKKFDRYSMEFSLAVWVDYKKKSSSGSREADFLWEIESTLRQHNIPLTTESPTIFFGRHGDNRLEEIPSEY